MDILCAPRVGVRRTDARDSASPWDWELLMLQKERVPISAARLKRVEPGVETDDYISAAKLYGSARSRTEELLTGLRHGK